MNLASILLIAFALSMDAFAVSVTKGMTLNKVNYSISGKIALFFGFFQGVMPLIGWCLGIQFESYIKSYDHWIAFILLGFIGLKMIFDAKDDKSESNSFKLNNKELFILSIATSIDALAIGVSFAFLKINIIPICISIAIITFSICFLGVLIGKKIGSLFRTSAQILGGIILILIGLNILNDHTGIISNIL
ncbi:manganese efflux pump MntP [Romboutsia lituseburensis]|uniref:Putative manganese efflux pump MntP n=1 Tax=Romboutsia lituseburensis DSM 797 TaxID=1121325 RepID=A0A1G9L2H6_9FIRM|nr:manganese efflux pump MntP family protein [Romboutsia lituseburensis]CEH35128.1 Probable manganese efflux pump MntP [mntP] [Romboutsia lituseburensis]SDL56208.1 Putative Mn2+ efflux pump MntP [Romboutsia lituseburensis DSM 797]